MARSWVGTGVLVASVLAVIAAGGLDRSGTAWLAFVAVAAIAARSLLSLADARAALGSYAASLDLIVELSLALGAAWLTGSVRSPLLVVPAAHLVLARRFHGAAAARFLAFATVAGLCVMASATPGILDRPAAAIARVLWPLAVLGALELALPVRAAASRRAMAEPLPAPWTLERSASPPPSPMLAPTAVAPPAAGPPAPPAPMAAPVVPAKPAAAAAHDRDLRAEIFHDLRSPISVIKVYADLIAERARRGEPPVDEHLRNLASEIDLMTQLVDAPGAHERRLPVPEDVVDLVQVMSELSSRYRETHGQKVRIEMSVERARVQVRADPVSLQRVFRNVLDNALQYTPAGGAVRVRLWADPVYAHVVVSDTGVGMSAEERERAFDLSYRGRGAQALRAGGRGLGLTLSRELVEAMGGSISLWSEEDRGSEVRVLLPVAPEMAS
ncbi:MAG TPA: HAMP domain-containing sensor histidine kinase [Vicinamibacteria bacterium]|nr:HAMP domain-containing sensor histidine kinase [Vicinamibacteria bacterium]